MPNEAQRQDSGPAATGGQKTFQLVRRFHAETCYRARSLTAEELVKRTFIGVDAATVKKLDKAGSHFDVSDCEYWHFLFDDRLETAPSCREIGQAAERLGFLVGAANASGGEYFEFFGVRFAKQTVGIVIPPCKGCECRCSHVFNRPGVGCDACECPCEGCYCANGCAANHPELDASRDPLMNLSAPDANEHHKSRQFKLAQGWHSDDCKMLRSFTADEIAQLLINPKLKTWREIPSKTGSFFDLNRFDFGSFDDPPSVEHLVDAFLRFGQPVYGYGDSSRVEVGYNGSDDGLYTSWWRPFTIEPRSYRGEWHCGGQLCDCRCRSCNQREQPPPGWDPLGYLDDPSLIWEPEILPGCADCDCACEGCFCPGTCESGHRQPEVQQCELDAIDRTRRGVPSRVQLSRETGKRFEAKVPSWHAKNCTAVRHVTAKQLVDLTVHRSDIHRLGERRHWVRSGLDCEDWRSWMLDYHHEVPTCREFADAATTLGFRVERIPKSWWQRQHYRLAESILILKDVHDRFGIGLREGLHCLGCECVCVLCDDCSDCDCSCENCYCAKRCRTSTCIVTCDLESGVYAVHRAHAQSDDQVGTDATILQTGRWARQQADAVSVYRLKRVARGWHLDGCAHTNRSYTADELVNLTFKPFTDGDAALDRDARYDLILPEYDCCALRGFYVDGYFESWPSCWALAAAARRSGYTIAPAGRRSNHRFLEIASTPSAHFDFLDADLIHLESSSGVGELLADERRCNSECDCDCKDACASCSCACRGCYCEKTCLSPPGI